MAPVAPDAPTPEQQTDFEMVIDRLGLQLFADALVEKGVFDTDKLRDMDWDDLKEGGLPVPLRSRVVDWQNDEVFVPRWSTGTFACASDKISCVVTTLCPCYTFNRVYNEAGVKPNPCPCFGCVAYLLCINFFPCIGAPTSPPLSFPTPRGAPARRHS